jgi:hypothetical protein
LAEEILDWVMLAMVAVTDQRVNGAVGDLVIVTGGIRTSLATRVNGFFATSPALPLCVRDD